MRSDDGGIRKHTLDELGSGLNRFTGTTVNLLKEFGKLASNVGSVAVKNWGVTIPDLAGVVHQDDLGVERLSSLGRVILRITGDVTT